jgi:hypothetical protein
LIYKDPDTKISRQTGRYPVSQIGKFSFYSLFIGTQVRTGALLKNNSCSETKKGLLQIQSMNSKKGKKYPKYQKEGKQNDYLGDLHMIFRLKKTFPLADWKNSS